jgi:hypothetical protein
MVFACVEPTWIVPEPVRFVVVTPVLDVPVAIWPIWLAFTPPARLTVMVSPTFAPTWKVAVPNVPSRTFWPLNDVCVPMRSTSARRC